MKNIYPWAELEQAASSWGIVLSAEQRLKIEGYLDFVEEANHKTNLSADSGPEALLLRHAADACAAAAFLRRLSPNATPSIADLGAGGGFIGIGVKILNPETEVWLIEGLQRKYDFLNAACLKLGLRGLHPWRQRAGSGSAVSRLFDVVVERALAPLPEALRLAHPLLKPGGIFIAFQSDPADPNEPKLAKALAATGLRLLESWPYRRPREAKDRFLCSFSTAISSLSL